MEGWTGKTCTAPAGLSQDNPEGERQRADVQLHYLRPSCENHCLPLELARKSSKIVTFHLPVPGNWAGAVLFPVEGNLGMRAGQCIQTQNKEHIAFDLLLLLWGF